MNRLRAESLKTDRAEAHMAESDLMRPSGLDLALAREGEMLPSSGFLTSVMERVQAEAAQAAAPEPISFPWKRVIPGILLTIAVLGWGGFKSIRQISAALTTLMQSRVVLSASGLQAMEPAAWVAGALAISLLCWWFSRNLTRRTGLL